MPLYNVDLYRVLFPLTKITRSGIKWKLPHKGSSPRYSKKSPVYLVYPIFIIMSEERLTSGDATSIGLIIKNDIGDFSQSTSELYRPIVVERLLNCCD